MKYNYVILGSSWDFYITAYRDVFNLPNVIYKSVLTEKSILNTISKIHLNTKLNSIINIPFKSIWNKQLLKNDFPHDSNLCFIVFYDWICRNIGILESIRKFYPSARVVIIFNDLIKVKRLNYTHAPLDIKLIKQLSDIVITFDFIEAQKYGLLNHHIPYSKPRNRLNNNIEYSKNSSDIYFLGQVKNRLDSIMEIYYKLKENNLKLNFILANVPKETRVVEEGIRYVDGMGVTYQDNLENIKKTRCILEIMQKDGSGYTSRTLEAIAYGKKLITNNQFIKEAPFYNEKNICLYSEIEDINKTFLETIPYSDKVDHNFIEQLSPIKLLEFIEEKLDIINQ